MHSSSTLTLVSSEDYIKVISYLTKEITVMISMYQMQEIITKVISNEDYVEALSDPEKATLIILRKELRNIYSLIDFLDYRNDSGVLTLSYQGLSKQLKDLNVDVKRKIDKKKFVSTLQENNYFAEKSRVELASLYREIKKSNTSYGSLFKRHHVSKQTKNNIEIVLEEIKIRR